jgi:acetyl-CoA carboxylase biotin carboxyl carrier protein
MPINEDFIFALIDKFSAAAVAELILDDGGTHIELRKEGAALPAEGAANGPAGPRREGLHLGLPVNTAPGKEGEAVTSPVVATFYAAPGPDSPAFVTVGSRVKSGDTLCVLEAMKMMNHLEAEFDCEILAIKASSGDLVEYGQVLFEVKRL